jgi:hypothetical protein
MVFYEDVEGFFASVFADEESRTFGEEAGLVRGIISMIRKLTHKTREIWRREGAIWRSEGILQAQSLVNWLVPRAIPDATMAPMKYDELNQEVSLARSFG